MYSIARRRLERIYAKCAEAPLRGRQIGLEKESLRVASNGTLSDQPHPRSLGAALTHPSITTDFSEALLEIVTPPYADMADTLADLHRSHAFVYSGLPAGEMLWATSMPCGLNSDCDVPIGYYGSSNIGHMKQVYRRGLALRYGRTMQAIAGVHYNYSYPDSFWQLLAEVDGEPKVSDDYISKQYFALTRNILRFGWLVPYLFGASPAVCGTFFGAQEPPQRMSRLGVNTWYEPYATCLRMGDIGYQNNRDEKANRIADYNSLDGYVKFLQSAISMPSKHYSDLGLLGGNGEYQQLNLNQLQIENEHYSSIRPKQIAREMEMPSIALAQRGVRYVELRSLDVNAYEPLGISDEQLRFVESFMLFCMLEESPPIDAADQASFKRNLLAVAHRGRDPELQLERGDSTVSLRDWGSEILDVVGELCDLLDQPGQPRRYCGSLTRQLEKIHDPTVTPSGRMLAELQQNDEDFFHFGMRMSQQHRDYFNANPLERGERESQLQKVAESLSRQSEIEQADQPPFDAFLASYFAQLDPSN